MNTPHTQCPARHVCPMYLAIIIYKTVSKTMSEIKTTLNFIREINRASSYEAEPR